MPIIKVCWEKTLFGFMYHRAAPSVFKTTLTKFQHKHKPLVYGELFYTGLSEAHAGSFTYTYNPVTNGVNTHLVLWSGHEESIVYRTDAKCEVVEWQYSLAHHGKPVAWPCIHPSIKHALASKTDAHIVLAKVTPTE